METKYIHTRGLLSEKTHPMIELFFEFAQLKNLYRQGWLKRDISKLDCETVADHSFSVALLGYLMAEEYRPDLDSQRVMKLGLFHELGEIYAGDTTPQDNVSIEDKSAREYASVRKVFPHISTSEKYVSIWREYENKLTPEAKFVGDIDKLEMALQANLYERLNYQGLDEFFIDVQQKIKSTELKHVLDDLLKIR